MAKKYFFPNGDVITEKKKPIIIRACIVVGFIVFMCCLFFQLGNKYALSKIAEADTLSHQNELYESSEADRDNNGEAIFEEQTTEKALIKGEPETLTREADAKSGKETTCEASDITHSDKGEASTKEADCKELSTTGEARSGATCDVSPSKTTDEPVTESSVPETTSAPERPVKDEYAFPIHYSDDTANIDIEKITYAGSVCYIAHLKFSDYSRFGSESAYGKYGSGYETTSHAAERLGAVFCVNGDYSAVSSNYGTIRHGYIANRTANGRFYPETAYNFHNGLLGNKSMLGISSALTIDEAVDSGLVTDTFQFAPAGLVNGVNNGDPNGTSRAQRTFIGTNGNPGDIYIVVSDGRYVDGKSAGLNGYECMQLLKERGCIFGNLLDGGGSSTMVYKGKILNTVSSERAVIDFVYFK